MRARRLALLASRADPRRAAVDPIAPAGCGPNLTRLRIAAARIGLVRHGPSAHVPAAGAIDRAGVEKWRDAYDSAGIRTDSEPPAALVRIAANASHIIASDLNRAVRSAERLAPRRQIRVSELFREAPLAIPRWPTRLPPGVWGAFITLGWSYRIVRGGQRRR